MKAGLGFLFLLASLVLLAAALAGGQVWVYAQSPGLGVATALVTAALLGAASRPLLRRMSSGAGRVLGEYHGAVNESDFVDAVDVVSDTSPRGKILHRVDERPERVAGSIRSMLARGGEVCRDGKGKTAVRRRP